MRAAREGNNEAAVLYLSTPLRGQRATELARQLFVVLDSRLPARLNDVSNDPEGSRANPLKPDEDVVGTLSTADGPLVVMVKRQRGRTASGPAVWLFSEETLQAVPGVYDDIDMISIDRYLPESLTRTRFAGIRLVTWLALFIVLPLLYKLIGLARLSGAFRLFVLAVAIRWLAASVDVPLRERQLWTAVGGVTALVSVIWMLLRLNAYGERYFTRRFHDSSIVEISSLVRLGRRFADVLVIVAGVLVAVRYFGGDPTAALAGLGIGGIAVALAAQKTLENVIGGLSLIFDKAVRVGDFLKVGDALGTVDSIGLRSTRIRTLDRTMLSVPNGQIANVSLETISARDMCWFHHVLGLRYGATALQLRRIMDAIRKLMAEHAAIDPQSVRVRLFRFGSSSLDIEIVAYAMTGDWPRFLEIQEQLLVGVMEIVEEAGAEIAFPTQTLHIAGNQPARVMTKIVSLKPASANPSQSSILNPQSPIPTP